MEWKNKMVGDNIDYLCQCGHPLSEHKYYGCAGREYQIHSNFIPPIETSIPCRCPIFRIGDRRYHKDENKQ